MGKERHGFCERHQLPLDAHGDCELCRLDAIPSRAPASRGLSWVVIAGAVLLIGGAIFAVGASRSSDDEARPPGVPVAQPTTVPAARQRPEPSRPSAQPRYDRPTSVPLPPRPGEHPSAVRTAPVPPRPTTSADDSTKSFSEDEAKAALREVRIEMYATTWCGSCRRAREYLDYNGIGYTEYDIDADPKAKERLAEINSRTSIPTFRIDDDIVQIGFSPETLEHKINQAVRERLLR